MTGPDRIEPVWLDAEVALAAGELTEEELADWFRQHIGKAA